MGIGALIQYDLVLIECAIIGVVRIARIGFVSIGCGHGRFDQDFGIHPFFDVGIVLEIGSEDGSL